MHLAFHGGKCCGVKTIYGFPTKPSEKVPSIGEVTPDNKDRRGATVSSGDRCFPDEAPKETGEARLDRYLDWLRDERPEGLVEVYLATTGCGCCDQMKNGWPELLEEKGFKKDEPFKNSNSGNWVTRFSMVMTRENKPKPKQKSLRETTAL